MNNINNLVVVTWDGKSKPYEYVNFDAVPNFDFLIFDYSGTTTFSSNEISNTKFVLSAKTENKGQIFQHLDHFLKENQLSAQYKYIGIIDDDILFKVSDFNYMLHIAQLHQLNIFQPSIAKDSYYSHRRFVNKPGYIVTYTDWIEIMAPFYDLELFQACGPYFSSTISGQGVDLYLMPVLQKIHKKPITGVINAVVIKHCGPVRSHQRLYSNGLDNEQEIELIRQHAIHISSQKQYKSLFDSRFNRQILKVGNPILIKIEGLFVSFSNLWHNTKRLGKEFTHFRG